MSTATAYCSTAFYFGAPAGIRTPNQQIMRRFEGHQQGETKRDNPVFTESAAVKVSYVLLRLSTPSRHNRAIFGHTLTVWQRHRTTSVSHFEELGRRRCRWEDKSVYTFLRF